MGDLTSRGARLGLPDLGVGVGLRIPHYGAILEGHPSVAARDAAPRDPSEAPVIDWFEIISENFMVQGGLPLHNLERFLARHRLVPHGVSLSVGGVEPLDFAYLRKLKELVARTGSPWVSDHLCWTGDGGVNLHDLLPLPYTDAAVRHVAERARAIQDYIEVPLALENVSSYLTFGASSMPEWEFLSRVAEEADCAILLDVNNVYVSAYNHGFDAAAYIDAVPRERVVQMHLAGHTNKGTHIIDTHDDHVIDAVWALYRRACARTGPVSVLIEWDDAIPPFETLVAEAAKARAIRDEVHGARAA
jgi:uncharacterized protein